MNVKDKVSLVRLASISGNAVKGKDSVYTDQFGKGKNETRIVINEDSVEIVDQDGVPNLQVMENNGWSVSVLNTPPTDSNPGAHTGLTLDIADSVEEQDMERLQAMSREGSLNDGKTGIERVRFERSDEGLTTVSLFRAGLEDPSAQFLIGGGETRWLTP